MARTSLILAIVSLLASCGDKTPDPPASSAAGGKPAPAADASHHGAIVALGEVALGGEAFAVARHGPALPGKESAFVVSRLGSGSSSALFLWVEDAAGQQISAPAEGDRADDAWHFHVSPRAGTDPQQVVVRLREGRLDERAALPLHAAAAPRRDGIAAPLHDRAGRLAGWLELKLHDDKGDLELWLAADAALTTPLDLPLDVAVRITFPTLAERQIELRPRNREQNEDEDGRPNVRAGRTNYFVFPGGTGADASWLAGAGFNAPVRVTVPTPEGELAAVPFALVPHAHGEGDHHH